MKNRVFFLILFGALVSFELFNYASTEFSLGGLIGGASILGIPWSVGLAFAFSGIDFAGLARMFTPETNFRDEPKEIRTLYFAWVIASLFNALLTWYGVAELVSGRSGIGNDLVSHDQVVAAAPWIIATIVYITRLLLIGTLAMTADHATHGKKVKLPAMPKIPKPAPKPKPLPKVSSPSSLSSLSSANSPNSLNVTKNQGPPRFRPTPAPMTTPLQRAAQIPPDPFDL